MLNSSVSVGSVRYFSKCSSVRFWKSGLQRADFSFQRVHLRAMLTIVNTQNKVILEKSVELYSKGGLAAVGQGSCSGSIYLDLGKQIQITDLGKVCIKEYNNPNEHVQDCCATGCL